MKKIFKTSLWIILALYTLFALWLLFVRDRGNSGMSISEHFTRYSNLLPFETIISDIKQMARGKNVRLYIRNFFGNTMLLFPFGLFLPFLTKRYKSAKRIFILFICVIITVELLQLLLCMGSVDTDDLILNVAGGMAGYGIYRLFSHKRLDNDA
ncbi:MAG: VanZ family protein [Clostridia bacterium]|nr:VanZ family protein [Clostridia bacterium]